MTHSFSRIKYKYNKIGILTNLILITYKIKKVDY